METVPLLAEGKGRGRAKESSESSIEKERPECGGESRVFKCKELDW